MSVPGTLAKHSLRILKVAHSINAAQFLHEVRVEIEGKFSFHIILINEAQD